MSNVKTEKNLDDGLEALLDEPVKHVVRYNKENWCQDEAPKSIIYQDLPMSWKYGGNSHTTYACPARRRKKGGCDSTVKVFSDGSVVAGEPHNIECYLRNGVPVPEGRGSELPSIGGDFTLEMEICVKDLALKKLAMPASKIWEQTVRHFEEINANLAGLTKDQVISLVYNTRRDNIGGNAVRKVESEHSGSSKNAILRYSSLFHDKDGAQRMLRK